MTRKTTPAPRPAAPCAGHAIVAPGPFGHALRKE
jgi:hypothetical protein